MNSVDSNRLLVKKDLWSSLVSGTQISYTLKDPPSKSPKYRPGGFITMNGVSQYPDPVTKKHELTFGLEGYLGGSLQSSKHKVNYIPYYRIEQLYVHVDPVIKKLIDLLGEEISDIKRKMQILYKKIEQK